MRYYGLNLMPNIRLACSRIPVKYPKVPLESSFYAMNH